MQKLDGPDLKYAPYGAFFFVKMTYSVGVNKPKVIAIVGPTASGKSSLGVYIAQKLGGEVVSAGV